ncbi:heme/hemin ABC transporter substrate-binding protein [Vibrio sonorensis]|uniref:heme/hemin ABC transporter substrate-binding protein n=1 Tax=Vibrio sonorensis TaxID=1004316 RepID=UPI0008D9AE3C|nr:hemin ABC transporter substrate-binding protein [Vibrio sonorensis]
MLKTTKLLAIWALSITLISLPTFANERIVSAGSAVTELLVALGAQDKLVAVDVTSQLPSGLELPKVGYHRRLSAEGLLVLQPTRLIGSDEMGPDAALNQLKSAGINVDVVNTLATPEGLLERIDDIARILDSSQKAKTLKANVEGKLAQLSAKAPSESEKKKVLFLLIHEGRPANVAGSDTTPNAIIELAGGLNPAASALKSYKPLSAEAIIEMQPDVVLVSGRSHEKLGGAEAIIQALPVLAATPAGQNKSVITIDGHALVGGLGLKSLQEAERLISCCTED